jgi:hypothetical protein
MPDKRMRPIVKQEPGADGTQQQHQHQQVAAGERDGQRRSEKDRDRDRADNARERNVIVRAANASDGARHILCNADRAKIQKSAEYDGM